MSNNNKEFNYQNYAQPNFDPNKVANQTSTVIQSVVIIDVSPSIASFEDDMNTAMSEIFMNELRNSHRKDDILLQGIEFCESVKFKSGFQPLTELDDDYLKVHNQGSGTAIYDAMLLGLQSVKSYREDLEAQGIEVRTNIFLITDGESNSDKHDSLDKLKKLIAELRTNEAWISNFTISMFGVGDSNSFTKTCKDMGLDPDKCLSTVGTSAKEIRAMMGVVSKSASSSTASKVSF